MTILLAAMNGLLGGGTEAVRELLNAVGESPGRNGLVDTPRRVIEAWREQTSCTEQTPESVVGRGVFELEEMDMDHPGLVALRDISFSSVSSDTLLPFYGTCHVVYRIASHKIVGLSKVARIVRSASKRIQSQQQFTDCVAEAIVKATGSREVAVFAGAVHVFYDRPLASHSTSSMTYDFSRNSRQDLQLLIPWDDFESETMPTEHDMHGHHVDQTTFDRIRLAVLGMFAGMRIHPTEEALQEYSKQMYWAMVGNRMCPVPSEDSIQPESSEGGSSELLGPTISSCVVDFVSTCEHHLLPFHGKIFVGCVAYDPVPGLSNISQLMEPAVWSISHQLQVQERLTNQVADYAMSEFGAQAVLVICDAVHLCMVARGTEAHKTTTRTMCRRGEVSNVLIRRGVSSMR